MTENSTESDRADQATEQGSGQDTAARLVRLREGRMVAGVCAGLARFTGIDPLVFRVVFGLLVLAEGQGILLYIAAALLMAEDTASVSLVEQTLKRRFDGGTVLIILGGLLGLGMLATAGHAGLSGGAVTTVTIVALVLLVAHARKVDLIGAARTLPERLQGRPFDPSDPPRPAGAAGAGSGPVSLHKSGGLPEGMIDLATLGQGSRPAYTPQAAAPAADTRDYAGTQNYAGTRNYKDTSDTWAAEGTGATAGTACAKPAGPRSVLAPIALLLAMMTAAAMIPVATGHPALNAVQIAGAAGLAVIGIGLVVAAAFGRGRGLVACGTVLSLGLMTTSVVSEAPVNGRFGDVEWKPVDATRSEQSYRVTVGDGRLDLTALPLGPGQRIRINAEIMLGELTVTVPSTARVEVDVRSMVGDATVDRRVTSGPRARVTQVLEPEDRPKNPPTIELRVRGKVGDVEVTRG